MARRTGLFVLTAFAIVAAPRAAAAMCGHTIFELGPRDGTVLPRDPTLLLVAVDSTFSLESAALDVRVDGERAPFSVTPIASAWMVHVRTGAGRELTVAAEWLGTQTYPIDPAWRRGATRIVDRARAEDHWTCSFTDVVRVSASGDASGLLVSWGGIEPGAAVVAARATRDGGRFVDGGEGPELVQAAGYRWFDLGHRNCQPWNVPQRLYQAGGMVSLSALHLDGTIEPLGEIPLRAEDLLESGGQVVDIGEVPQPDPQQPGPAVASQEETQVPVLVRVLVLVIVLGVGLRRVTRKRFQTVA